MGLLPFPHLAHPTVCDDGLVCPWWASRSDGFLGPSSLLLAPLGSCLDLDCRGSLVLGWRCCLDLGCRFVLVGGCDCLDGGMGCLDGCLGCLGGCLGDCLGCLGGFGGGCCLVLGCP